MVPPDIVRSMQLRAETLHPVRRGGRLRLTGQLALDPGRLVHVTTRFPGEVVEVAAVGDPATPLRVGMPVERGQLLAVLWSRDMGEKKSDLVDALSQLYLHRSLYERLKALDNQGVVPQRTIDEMERTYESDVIEVERVRRTLTSWRVPANEIEAIEQEAQRIHAEALRGPRPMESTPPAVAAPRTAKPASIDTWANIEIRSPITGTILERNLTVGDIVDTATDLFKVADLGRLQVLANIYEEDLPTLLSLPRERRIWEVLVNADRAAEPVVGTIDIIGNVIDPNQHTAVLQGAIDNHAGRLRVGQFIEASIEVPPLAGVWEIPVTALLDVAGTTRVFVATTADLTRWRPAEVEVARRTGTMAWLSAAHPLLKEGAALLVDGGLELSAAYDALAAEPVAPTP